MQIPPGSAYVLAIGQQCSPRLPAGRFTCTMTSPRLTPIRNLTWRARGSWSLRVPSAACTLGGAAHGVDGAAKFRQESRPPAVLKTRPAVKGRRAIRKSACAPEIYVSVCSSSSAIRRLYSATSAERMVTPACAQVGADYVNIPQFSLGQPLEAETTRYNPGRGLN